MSTFKFTLFNFKDKDSYYSHNNIPSLIVSEKSPKNRLEDEKQKLELNPRSPQDKNNTQKVIQQTMKI